MEKNYFSLKKEGFWIKKCIDVTGPWRIVSVFILILLLGGCQKEDPQPVELLDVRPYVPLKEGQVWIYEKTSIHIDAAVEVFDTSYTQVKINYSHFDSSLTQHVLLRSSRADTTELWQEEGAILCDWDEGQFLWFEDNIRYLKLIDPASPGMEWDGNIYSILEACDYQYSALNTTFERNGTIYNDVVIVDKGMLNNSVLLKDGTEVFAKGIGSVYSYFASFTKEDGVEVLGDSEELSLLDYIEL